jgi:hypothetical protein
MHLTSCWKLRNPTVGITEDDIAYSELSQKFSTHSYRNQEIPQLWDLKRVLECDCDVWITGHIILTRHIGFENMSFRRFDPINAAARDGLHIPPDIPPKEVRWPGVHWLPEPKIEGIENAVASITEERCQCHSKFSDCRLSKAQKSHDLNC